MDNKQELWNEVLKELDLFISKNTDKNEIYKHAIDIMAKLLPHFNWTGLYFLDGGVLRLFDYYIGKPTEHTKINVGQGVCGTAVAENHDIIVDDVLKLDNYLACSVETRSEIVVLIRNPDNNEIIGQIDVDSDNVEAFDETDKINMQKVAERLGKVSIR